MTLVETRLARKAEQLACLMECGHGDMPDTLYSWKSRIIGEASLDEQVVCAALLSDVLSRIAATKQITDDDFKRLSGYGFSQEMLDALEVLREKNGVSYEDYIKAVMGNDIARRTRIADLKVHIAVTVANKMKRDWLFSARRFALKILVGRENRRRLMAEDAAASLEETPEETLLLERLGHGVERCLQNQTLGSQDLSEDEE